MLEQGAGSPLQFAGFLAPAALILVGATPDYLYSKSQFAVHLTGVVSAVLFALLYFSILLPLTDGRILIPMWVLLGICFTLCLLIHDAAGFWCEMALYILIYVEMYLMLWIR